MQDTHDPGRSFIQIFAEAVFEQRNIDYTIPLGHADSFKEVAD